MKLVPISELFDIVRGTNLDLNALREVEGGIPYISCTGSNNGVLARVARVPGVAPSPSGVLSVALVGNAMASFLQVEPFYSAQNIEVLTPKSPLSWSELLYYASCLRANQFRFSYGRKANRTMRELLVPALDEVPAWAGVLAPKKPADLWPALHGVPFRLATSNDVSLQPKGWAEFELAQLFEVNKGRRLTKDDMEPGGTLYVGATESDNGETGRIGQEALHPGGQITVSYNGSVAEAFYQPEPFWASDDVNVLYPKFAMSVALAMFFVTVIRLEKYRYNYGRKWRLEVMKATTLRLPATAAGDPDWAAMENTIQGCPSWPLLSELLAAEPATAPSRCPAAL